VKGTTKIDSADTCTSQKIETDTADCNEREDMESSGTWLHEGPCRRPTVYRPM
jgi:hypothetical protein